MEKWIDIRIPGPTTVWWHEVTWLHFPRVTKYKRRYDISILSTLTYVISCDVSWKYRAQITTTHACFSTANRSRNISYFHLNITRQGRIPFWRKLEYKTLEEDRTVPGNITKLVHGRRCNPSWNKLLKTSLNDTAILFYRVYYSSNFELKVENLS